EDELRLKLYKLIIDRYRDMIEQGETRSVTDLKAMIVPHHEKLLELRESITENFHPYVYEEHFLQAAKMCFEHVSSFKTISAPISFWLEFSEMQFLMAGDEIDKSILLCSLLRSLGSQNAKVFMTDNHNSYVLFQFGSKSYIADYSQKELVEKETGEAALESLKGKIIYSFNDKEYESFQE
ncbi:MAG: hypothetical protein NTV88_05985, partial [Candidatus Micrarchaeota archaeon]|nr:hypothetical protein [Candidatus Micrarchaeota archaeon]